MSTHGHGRGKRGITFVADEPLAKWIKTASKQSGLSMNAYVVSLLRDAQKKGVLVRRNDEIYPGLK